MVIRFVYHGDTSAKIIQRLPFTVYTLYGVSHRFLVDVPIHHSYDSYSSCATLLMLGKP